MNIIETADGTRWRVVTLSRLALPLKVEALVPWHRGSFLEAHLNLRLAVHSVKAECQTALPHWLQRLIPFPRAWWIVITEES